MTVINLHSAKLPVGDFHHAYVTFVRQPFFDALNMNLCIVGAAAMPDVDRELKHGESVFEQMLPKIGCCFALGFGFRRQIKKYQNPHNPIFAKPRHIRQNQATTLYDYRQSGSALPMRLCAERLPATDFGRHRAGHQ